MAPKKNDLGAFDRALLILAGRPHSAVELRRKLRLKRHAPEEIEAALTRLHDLGYLDDVAFARSLIGWRSGSRGRRAMAAELAARGVSREVASAALAEVDPGAELDSARRLAKGQDDPIKAAGRLRRRGFGEDTIRSVLRNLAD